MIYPNFMIIGAKKAATTSLYSYLLQHPDVFMPSPKEPNYYAFEAENPDFAKYSRQAFPVRTEKEYLKLFAKADTSTAIGEASVGYLESPVAPVRIKQDIPDCRFICSLRNPVDRTYSGYVMRVRSGKDHRTVEQAIIEDRGILRERSYRHTIARWFGVFPRNQFKFVLFDDIKNRPADVVRELFQFLDIDPDVPVDMSKQLNKGGVVKNQALQRVVNQVRAYRRYRDYVPQSMRQRFQSVAQKNLAPTPPMPENVRNLLYDIYRDEFEYLEDLVGMDLSEWKRTAEGAIRPDSARGLEG